MRLESESVTMKIVTLHFDSDLDCPSDWDGQWMLYSFNRRHKSYRSPETFFPEGAPTPEFQRQLDEGLAFVLSYFEHGNCVWSLQDTGPQCRWDNVDCAGILVWEHPAKDMGAKTKEDRAKDATKFLEVYTAWCNGEGYGYSVEEIVTLPCGHTETRDLDSCFGFYGTDVEYMASQCKDAVAGDPEVEIRGEAKDLADHYDFGQK